jgi:hypothetical protein
VIADWVIADWVIADWVIAVLSQQPHSNSYSTSHSKFDIRNSKFL